MSKLIVLSIVVGSFMFAGIHGEDDNAKNQPNTEKYSWLVDSSDDMLKAEASRRRGKPNRNRRRGGGGLR